MFNCKLKALTLILGLSCSALASAALNPHKPPSENFDLSKWMLNVPMEDTKPERQGQVMEVSVQQLNKGYTQSDWFYTDQKTGAMVFVAPNKAMTTPNSKNARSELHAMLDPTEGINEFKPSANFVLSSHDNAQNYGAVGGKLSAVLSVDHVSTSGDHRNNDSFSVVIGQIHSKDNEPLKIFYRKLPDQEYGSVYWNYENNATGVNKSKRLDISHDVFGKSKIRYGQPAPIDGIKLGEKFAYSIDVVGEEMHLVFTKNLDSAKPIKKTFVMNIAKGHYLGNTYDEGYAQSVLHFKAGVYNQCNVGPVGCKNNGIAAGDYAKASFYKLDLEQ
ncbi:putative alginate lyase [Vibrio halioticoli NBRC 102217]|uniref:Putative alginate lyase n=1 Tax=Vibrio halioticoli NBRC 102217 TaxID=1219072 RepID=V5HFN8_9VIBR|nr:polysaccharide lyase family 7 protein [Vibrio halioticoli]GAD88325.1 putative alginate lyase [Vibrio halioticoli NBRC 102217]